MTQKPNYTKTVKISNKMGKDLTEYLHITRKTKNASYLGRTATNLPENHFFKAISALRQLH